MLSEDVKYTQAYDAFSKKWISASEFDESNKAEWYDRPRYYSSSNIEDESCEILGYVRKSVPFRRKNMKEETPDIVMQAHFAAIATNTEENRLKLFNEITAQESNVHKLAKEIGRKISKINIPEVKCDVFGNEVTIIERQTVSVEYISEEEHDLETGRIPDLKFKTTINGIEEVLWVELFYSHRVDFIKRMTLKNAKINCLEVDISRLKMNTKLSKRQLENAIRNEIENSAYWICNSMQEVCERNLISEYMLEISHANGLFRKSNRFSDFDKRLYAFKDSIRFPDGHPCCLHASDSHRGDASRMIEPVDCKNCEHCLCIEGYRNESVAEFRVLCIKDMRLATVPRINIINFIREDMIKKYKEIAQERKLKA